MVQVPLPTTVAEESRPRKEAEFSVSELDGVRSLNIKPAESELPTMTEESDIAAEKFRLLSLRLLQAQERREFKRLLVTSSAVQDGKSFITANLCFTLAAREKKRVLMIEGDLRRPRLTQIYGLGELKGLSDWVDEPQAAIKDYVYKFQDYPLWLLPAGQKKLSALEVLHSERLSQLMQQVSAWFDYVVIDSPPLVPLADAHVWETLTDSTLLVVREGQTPKKMLEKSLEMLDRNKLVAAVLNEATLPRNKYYQYYSSQRGDDSLPNKPEKGN
jgi:capsular exopolysaccharide synthesis family protein